MIYSIINYFIITLGFISSFYLFYKFPKINKINKIKLPPITIIIPARNEENTIGLLLSDLSIQTFKDFQVIVSDDGSIDFTKKVVKNFDVDYIYINQNEKPKDYLGKSWAIEYASTYAKYDHLLFLDADVRLEPNAIESLITTYLENDSIISVQPYHVTEKYYEQLSIPFNTVMLTANNTTTKNPKPFGLFGPCILIKKSNYEKINKHFLVRNIIIEDVALGEVLTNHQLPFKCYIGNPLIKYRMYPDGLKSFYQGWIKNIAGGASKTPITLIIPVFFFIASILASVFNFILLPFDYSLTNLLLYTSIYLIWIVRLYFITRNIGKFKFLSYITLPFIYVIFLFIFIISLLKKLFKISVVWKGRRIKGA